MKIETKVKLHNRFDIEVRDKDTGELKQTGVAENIILDRAYTRICTLNTYFSRIVFGSGTGELSPERQTLFGKLGSKVATFVESVKAYPTSKVTRRIVLNPEEFIGSTITEVGISEHETYINTHALIKDSKGNTLSITKTGTDVVTIYATVFIVFENPSSDFQFIGFPNNKIVRYFCDDVVSSFNSVAVSPDLTMHRSGGSSAQTGEGVSDITNKKYSVQRRFGTTQGNVHIRSLALPDNVKIRLPYEGVFSGYHLTDVLLGNGDGTTTEFPLPDEAKNIIVKKNGVPVPSSNYHIKNSPLTTEYFTSIYDLPGFSYSNASVAISPNGSYIIFALREYPFFSLYKFDAFYDYEFKQNLVTNNMSGGWGKVTFSANSNFIATGHNGSPYCTLFKRSDITQDYEFFQELESLPERPWDFSFSPSGSFLAVAVRNTGGTEGQFFLYRQNTTTGFYELKQTFSANEGRCVAFNSDGSKLLLAPYESTPVLHIYSYNEAIDDYEFMQSIPSSGVAQQIIFSPNDEYILQPNTAPPTRVYRWSVSEEKYTLFQDISYPSYYAEYPYTGTFSSDGEFVFISYDVSNANYTSLAAYQRNSLTGEYEHFYNLPYSTVGYGYTNVLFGPQDDFIFVQSNKHSSDSKSGTFIHFNKDSVCVFDTPPDVGDTITASYDVDYIPKTKDYVLDVTFEFQFGEV